MRIDRRTALGLLVSAPLAAACDAAPLRQRPAASTPLADPVRSVAALGETPTPWPVRDPFLFCVHHDDAYPAGNPELGPADSLVGRELGSDFDPREPYRMYHGAVVPGFPQHPHRGFETVTMVRRGLVDHSDSLGAAARYGRGDVQWLTAGGGIVHAEMFPLLDARAPNPLELFQIWLNLPSRDKMAAPHFAMLWGDTIPRQTLLDAAGRATELTVVAGAFANLRAAAPPPKSWAARAESDVAIWTLKLAPRASFALPAARTGADRTLYAFRGAGLTIAGRAIAARSAVELDGSLPALLENGEAESELLMLQGRPIGEPVARRGPFVMNTRTELEQAFVDYRATGFGGWPWRREDPVHDREARFARHADGHVEMKG